MAELPEGISKRCRPHLKPFLTRCWRATSFRDEQPFTYQGVRTIADLEGVSERTVFRWVRDARADGWIIDASQLTKRDGWKPGWLLMTDGAGRPVRKRRGRRSRPVVSDTDVSAATDMDVSGPLTPVTPATDILDAEDRHPCQSPATPVSAPDSTSVFEALDPEAPIEAQEREAPEERPAEAEPPAPSPRPAPPAPRSFPSPPVPSREEVLAGALDERPRPANQRDAGLALLIVQCWALAVGRDPRDSPANPARRAAIRIALGSYKPSAVVKAAEGIIRDEWHRTNNRLELHLALDLKNLEGFRDLWVDVRQQPARLDVNGTPIVLPKGREWTPADETKRVVMKHPWDPERADWRADWEPWAEHEQPIAPSPAPDAGLSRAASVARQQARVPDDDARLAREREAARRIVEETRARARSGAA